MFSFSSCWGNLFKKAFQVTVLKWIGMKFGKNVLQVNTDPMTESGFLCDVTL